MDRRTDRQTNGPLEEMSSRISKWTKTMNDEFLSSFPTKYDSLGERLAAQPAAQDACREEEVRSFVRFHSSLILLLHTARLARALCCTQWFAC